uniref:Uncharacterized protein n=1 Tax=Anguilla anguilla TaxID=7936 RepID=A0A0E9TTN0_ANGAN
MNKDFCQATIMIIHQLLGLYHGVAK